MKIILAAALMAFLYRRSRLPIRWCFQAMRRWRASPFRLDWEPKETETGVDATSADGAIYISVDVANAKTSDKVIDEAIAFLLKNGVKIDGSTQKAER